MVKREAPAGVAPGIRAGRRSGELLFYNTECAKSPDGAIWSLHRLDSFEARLAAAIECPWFVDWFRGMASGRAACIHCGSDCRDTALVGATQIDDEQLVTITVCSGCAARSTSFEAAARAAVDAAEAGVLSDSRSFKHGMAGPQGRQ